MDSEISPGSSWPGELISQSDIDVQPQREGTLVEFSVKLGQRVVQGQNIARLSAPAVSPDLVKSLAEQAENLTKAKTQAEATATFTTERKRQLLELKVSLEKSTLRY